MRKWMWEKRELGHPHFLFSVRGGWRHHFIGIGFLKCRRKLITFFERKTRQQSPITIEMVCHFERRSSTHTRAHTLLIPRNTQFFASFTSSFSWSELSPEVNQLCRGRNYCCSPNNSPDWKRFIEMSIVKCRKVLIRAKRRRFYLGCGLRISWETYLRG